ncbi:MAG TPA: alpha/beta hydrolase [Beijerinckiaceae bacterium]
MTEPLPFQDLFVSASDGLRLYARDYDPGGDRLPVVCLPGLARTSADFHALAIALSRDADAPRRILCLDYRGRGRSDWDRNWRNYDLKVETADVLQVLTVAGVHEAVIVGTSRGGLIAMSLAALRPSLLRGVVLNDVGPVIDGKGLVRIRGYVGALPAPRSLDEGAEILKRLSDAQFPSFTRADWRAQAEVTWREQDGRLVPAYDPALRKTLEGIDLETPLPTLWPLFEGLGGVPVLVLRGAHSDILSAGTLAEMERRHPRLRAVTVPGQGHAPVLAGPLVEEIVGFVRDAGSRVATPIRTEASTAAP